MTASGVTDVEAEWLIPLWQAKCKNRPRN